MKGNRRQRCEKSFHVITVLMFLALVALMVFTNMLLETLVMDEIAELSVGDTTITSLTESEDFIISNVKRKKLSPSYHDDDVKFFLFTKTVSTVRILFNSSWSNLDKIGYNTQDPTKIIVHGFSSGMNLYSLINMRNAYITKGSYNIIAVDWQGLAEPPYYPNAVHNVPYVGACLAQLIQKLKDCKPYNISPDIHIIGFSLGAHVPAFAAQILKPYKVPRITGLDPALPFFITAKKTQKLDASDAEFVDIMHTNSFVQGQFKRCGHIDFYMNGGVQQPGCWDTTNPFNCNHQRAAEYYVESINTKSGFWGWRCSGFVSYVLNRCPPKLPAVKAGDDVDKRYRGFFLVKTNANKPFAQGLLPFNR